MGLFKTKDKHEKIVMYHCDGLPLRSDCPLNVILNADTMEVVFQDFTKGGKEIRLPISKITRTGNVPIEDIEKGHMIGRAIVGGILFGEAGAIVGAMTAQEKRKTQYLYCINYRSDEEEKAIVLKSGGSINEMKFRRSLNDLLPEEESSGSVIL